VEGVSKEVKRESKKKEEKRVERERRAGVKEREKEAKRGSEEKREVEKELWFEWMSNGCHERREKRKRDDGWQELND
jgi:hypothetical protein